MNYNLFTVKRQKICRMFLDYTNCNFVFYYNYLFTDKKLHFTKTIRFINFLKKTKLIKNFDKIQIINILQQQIKTEY